VGRRGTRPEFDERVDAVLAAKMSPAQHRLWWEAEGAMLGGLTPLEALRAGEREAVIELAIGRPGADWRVPLISDQRAADILASIERDLRRGGRSAG
jgi:hypothetical protein